MELHLAEGLLRRRCCGSYDEPAVRVAGVRTGVSRTLNGDVVIAEHETAVPVWG
jgi:hypothetical protein